jgi:hypothetical protein
MEYQVENFKYNGFCVFSEPGVANYTAKFKEWTNDPGIAVFICSDGIERKIPTCCLIGDDIELPEQIYPKEGHVLFGPSSES